jgi:hypothetical protein
MLMLRARYINLETSKEIECHFELYFQALSQTIIRFSPTLVTSSNIACNNKSVTDC